MPITRFQVVLQFDTKLSRAKFDNLVLQLVQQLEAAQGRGGVDLGHCVYIATEMETSNLIRNIVNDDIEVGVG